ncbi:hypothetical protein QQ020_07020 [Fulvivirgaceae bacterium BMA12]|uniref:Uncharacterized protein n=1 Tax=Agaribacillus aureus TaxID=3051825 RepID=A0ABT8L218_9BACT|nr:hypothetical protein [Fulvivirgaceae bacterium BMA12]
MFVFLSPALAGQEKGDTVNQFQFKDGLYLSLEEFKTNNPSIPLDKNELGRIGNGSVIRMKRIKYGSEEEDNSISSYKVLFICLDGVMFINHKSIKNKKNHYPVSNFYRIHRVGYFCNYFLQTYNRSFYRNAKKVEAFTHVFVPGMNINVYEISVGPHVPEYVLYLGNGKIYSVDGAPKTLKSFINQDKYFSSTRIKNDELMIYLGLYNKRNPYNFGQP